MPIKHKLDKPALQALLTSPQGAVAKNMLARGYRVASQAKRNLQRPPQRVNTGHLRASISAQLVMINGLPAVRVGTSVAYAIYVHEGTGLYGPKHQVIRPRTAKVLAFKMKSGGNSKKIFARFTRGMQPNPFLKDAIKAAKI